MLNGIPKILSPALLKALCEMGHGDRIVLADGNFPVGAYAGIPGLNILRADGHGIPGLLDAILSLMPLDGYTDRPVWLMRKMDRDKDLYVSIHKEYERIILNHDGRGAAAVDYLERFDFYDRIKDAHTIVFTGESAIYANIALQKGVV
jgi:L-fucose mutarotase